MTSILAFSAMAFALAVAVSPAAGQPRHGAKPAALLAPKVEDAADGIFAAFRTHPLVGLSDRHNLAQAGAFYAALVRDPRFAREVGNLVVEFGGAAHQAEIDRYVAGEDVPYAELRQVWMDLAGWTPDQVGQMYANVFASVREANAGLPKNGLIRVWLGEPPIDWSQVRTSADLQPFMAQRETYPAGLIGREILDRGRKALVIYGGGHFFYGPPGIPSLGQLIARDHPGAFFVAATYAGYPKAACDSEFEAKAAGWRTPALVGPIAGTWLDAALRTPGCQSIPKFAPPPPGAPPLSPERQTLRVAMATRSQLMASGALADSVLYLGPAAGLTRTPYPQDLYLDESYWRETQRRQQVMQSPDVVTPSAALEANRQARIAYRPK